MRGQGNSGGVKLAAVTSDEAPKVAAVVWAENSKVYRSVVGKHTTTSIFAHFSKGTRVVLQVDYLV